MKIRCTTCGQCVSTIDVPDGTIIRACIECHECIVSSPVAVPIEVSPYRPRHQFFMHMRPPTTTAQMHEIRCVKGKPIVYDPPSVVRMKARLSGSLYPFAPRDPFVGPLRLTVKWVFTGKKQAWKDTKPDVDNMQKALQDAMTKLKFWKDDAQVSSMIVDKFTDTKPGIFVRIEALS